MFAGSCPNCGAMELYWHDAEPDRLPYWLCYVCDFLEYDSGYDEDDEDDEGV